MCFKYKKGVSNKKKKNKYISHPTQYPYTTIFCIWNSKIFTFPIPRMSFSEQHAPGSFYMYTNHSAPDFSVSTPRPPCPPLFETQESEIWIAGEEGDSQYKPLMLHSCNLRKMLPQTHLVLHNSCKFCSMYVCIPLCLI